MSFWKSKNLFPVLLVIFLLGLLGLLAGLQYKWLGQISDAERERMESRLQDDTQRFAEDFNRELQSAYFALQPTAESFKKNDWSEFYKRFSLWQKEAKYPEIVENLYFVRNDESRNLFHFNKENGRFETAVWTEDLEKIKPKLSDEKNFQAIDADNSALLAVVFEDKEDFRQIVINRKQLLTENKVPAPLDLQNRFGFLIIKLNENIIKERIFNDLTEKYFAKTDTANFNLAIVDGKNQTIFKTSETPINSSDATAKLFQITPATFTFFAKENLPEAGNLKTRQSVVFSQIETNTSQTVTQTQENKVVDVKIMADSKPRVTLMERNGGAPQSAWTLNVQHSAGSLEQFITNTRNRNLAVSFGILTLLAASVVLIFVSAQRSKKLAQRQMDFVSSVSHEFRTPLAVIYSAGENLTDGVVNSQTQISKYGELIKGEGKKLSAMVEQILEFAGARSGKRKFDFRPANIEEIIENALRECQPLIEEKEFLLEREIAENLPKISADSNALSHAIQNLIINSIKYSNGNRWLKISAKNGGGDLKISVEDKGIGISKKDQTHIFEPFFRAKTVVDEQIHGNGLGLSLVKQIVEAHKGKIKVESETGKGSKFIVHFPLNI